MADKTTESIYHLIDRHGIRYCAHSFRDRYSWDFFLTHDSCEIGRVLCTQEPDHLRLGDIHLHDELLISESLPQKLIRKLRGLPPPTISYRNRGIGTAMFALLERLALEAGFTCIEGWISRVDADPNPGLFDWYRRRGFTVTMESSQYVQQVATISKHLVMPDSCG